MARQLPPHVSHRGNLALRRITSWNGSLYYASSQVSRFRTCSTHATCWQNLSWPVVSPWLDFLQLFPSELSQPEAGRLRVNAGRLIISFNPLRPAAFFPRM